MVRIAEARSILNGKGVRYRERKHPKKHENTSVVEMQFTLLNNKGQSESYLLLFINEELSVIEQNGVVYGDRYSDAMLDNMFRNIFD